jgi:hypothetical protein
VIEAGAGEISSEEAKAGLRAAFASIEARLAELGDEAPPAPVAEAPLSGTAFVAPAPAAEEVAAAAIAKTSDAAPVEVPAETPASSEASVAEARAETEVAGPTETALAGLAEAETAAIADAAVADEAADAYDEAMLDLIAQEMGAPDEYETDDTAAMLVEEAHIADLAPADPEIAAAAPEPIAAEPAAEAPIEMARQATVVEIPPQGAVETAPAPAQEVSLGSSLIASGLVRKPIAANDPLAPIRRMSQAEKIAFFS